MSDCLGQRISLVDKLYSQSEFGVWFVLIVFCFHHCFTESKPRFIITIIFTYNTNSINSIMVITVSDYSNTILIVSFIFKQASNRKMRQQNRSHIHLRCRSNSRNTVNGISEILNVVPNAKTKNLMRRSLIEIYPTEFDDDFENVKVGFDLLIKKKTYKKGINKYFFFFF